MTPNERLERTQWDLWWLPDDATVHRASDATWVSCERPVHYLNTVVRLRAPASRAPVLHERVIDCASHGQVRWMITDTWDSTPFARELIARGYEADHDGRAVVIDTGAWEGKPRLRCAQVATLDQLRAASEVMEAGFGRTHQVSEGELRGYLASCTGPGARIHRFLALDPHDRPIATGGLNLFPELSFGLLWGGTTLPDARGQGAYTAVLHARIQAAREAGARWVGMYANAQTSAPIALAKGFQVVGEMAMLHQAAGQTA